LLDITNLSMEGLKDYFSVMFEFYPKSYQLDFAYSCINNKYVLGNFCRQSGKSTTLARVSIVLARVKNKQNVLIFAPTDRQTGLLAEKIREAINKMPTSMSFKCVRSTQREFYFNNGSCIICETVGDTGETLRGYTAHVIILEEAGSIKDSIVQQVILPMGATTGAKVIKIGTPRKKNHFYDSFVSNKYKIHLYDWTYPVKEGLITKEYVDDIKNSVPDSVFRTEMCGEFIEDMDAYFPYDLINQCIDKDVLWHRYTPLAGKIYYIGADIARLGQDSTCLVVIEVDSLMKTTFAKVVQIIELQKCTMDIVIDKIVDVYKHYSPKRVFIDETGLGAGVSDLLGKKFNQIRLITGTQINKFPKSYEYGDKIIGVKFTIQSKLDMFSNLKVLMEQGRIKLPNHPKLVAQLRDLRYETTENMNIKLHHSEYGFDDFVDALVLSCKEVNAKKIAYSF
jgi:phage FluMu gp28-like protein